MTAAASALQTRRRQGFPELRLRVCTGGNAPQLAGRGLDNEQTPLTCKSAATLDSPLGYHIVGQKLGAGTISVVYKGRRAEDGKEVALKCVRSQEEEVRRLTQAEFELLQSVNHSGITNVYDLVETPNEMWISMELCSGSLGWSIAQKGTVSVQRAQSYSKQLLEVVNYLHLKRIVHRDLKPDNILLKGGDKLLKVTDFNSARRIGMQSGPERSCMLSFRGTPCFSPPEVRLEQNWNERVDIWALGLCVYYMLHARLPFDITRPEVLLAFGMGTHPKVEWDNGISELLRNFIRQALSVNMEERPPAMELLFHPALQMEEAQEAAVRSVSAPCSLRLSASSTGPPRQLFCPNSPIRPRKTSAWEQLAHIKCRRHRSTKSDHRRFSMDFASPTLVAQVWDWDTQSQTMMRMPSHAAP